MKSVIQKRIDDLVVAHGGLRAAARKVGVDPGYLSRLRSGEKRNPTIETLTALGIRVQVTTRYEVCA